MTAVPLVPAKTQFDGGPHASTNCTATSGARLLRYATGINVTGSAVRAKQSDQSGGTSIPDIMRALHNGWSLEPSWASPDDSNGGRSARPANRVATYIGAANLKGLLGQGYMVIVQGDYGNLPLRYREQASFTDDHAFTVDAYAVRSGVPSVYVVDTIPRASEHYEGRWIPLTALLAYAYGLAGQGRIYAAWAKPPKPAPEDDMEAFGAPQHPSTATAKRATKLWTRSDRTGTSYDIPAGHTKRYSGGPVDGSLVIVHDRDNTVEGKTNLFGNPPDWDIKVIP